MCDQRTETERLLAEQRDRALSDRDWAEAHVATLQFRVKKLEDAIERHKGRRVVFLGWHEEVDEELWSVLEEPS